MSGTAENAENLSLFYDTKCPLPFGLKRKRFSQKDSFKTQIIYTCNSHSLLLRLLKQMRIYIHIF